MKRNKKKEREIAKKRIEKLFKLCEETVEDKPELAKRYSELAIKISTKYKVKLPREFKRRICKKCGSFLKPGLNLRIRFRGEKAVYTCLNCGAVKRYPYLKEKQEKIKKIKGEKIIKRQRKNQTDKSN